MKALYVRPETIKILGKEEQNGRKAPCVLYGQCILGYESRSTGHRSSSNQNLPRVKRKPGLGRGKVFASYISDKRLASKYVHNIYKKPCNSVVATKALTGYLIKDMECLSSV